jgi:hypothetical protein
VTFREHAKQAAPSLSFAEQRNATEEMCGTGHWTHYWTNKTVRDLQSSADSRAYLVGHTAGNMFRQRGVAPGDVVYVATRLDGTITLLGRLEVSDIVDQRQAAKQLKTTNVWDASDHVLAAKFAWREVSVPPARLRRVNFLDPHGKSPR